MTKQQKTNLYTAVAQAFCRTPGKKEQLRREARLRQQIDAPFTPVFRFADVTDVHINAERPVCAERLREMFRTAYAYSRTDEGHPTLDAVIFSGDNTDWGGQDQYDILNGVLRESVLPETKILTVSTRTSKIIYGLR